MSGSYTLERAEAVSHALATRIYEERSEEQDWIDGRATELLAVDFNPFDADNVAEGLGESLDDIAVQLSWALHNNADGQIATTVRRALNAYWERRARERARKEWAERLG